MAVTKRLRFEILRRDNHACRYCGGVAPDAVLTVDHVVPVALGGSDDADNLVAACRDCNAGKSASSPDAALLANVAQDAIRWAAAIKQAAEEASAALARREEYAVAFDETWNHWWLVDQFDNRHGPIPRPDNWRDSVFQVAAAGLTVEELCDAVRNAMGRKAISADDKWAYTCGICWTILRQRHDRAREIVAGL